MKVNLEKIRDLRKQKKLSQEKVAFYLGYDNVFSYHRKEKGEQPFLASDIMSLSNLFNQPCEYFFDQNVAKNATN